MDKKFKVPRWRNPNRMLFESGYRAFDRAVDLISDGNVISNVQLSTAVRRVSDLNGYPQGIGPGECRKHDLDRFRNRPDGIPRAVREYVDARPEEEFWLYCWHFPGTRSERGASVAWLLTDKAMTKPLVRVCGRQRKAYLVLREAEKYVVKRAERSRNGGNDEGNEEAR